MAMVFSDVSDLFQQDNAPATMHTLLKNGLRNMMKSSRCCPGFQVPQISIWLRICGMCWTNHSSPIHGSNIQDLKDLLLKSSCQIPQDTFRGLLGVKVLLLWLKKSALLKVCSVLSAHGGPTAC